MEPSTWPQMPAMVRSPMDPGSANDHVASGGPQDLGHGAGTHPAAHGAEVRIAAAHGDRDAGGQAEPLRPLGSERAGALVGGVGVVVEAPAQVGKPWVETAQEVGARKAAPGRVPHRLVAGGSAPAAQFCRAR